MELNFVSNSNINKNGFVAIFNQLNNSCYQSRELITNSVTGFVSDVNLNQNENNCITQKFYSFEGDLKSPNFPSFYNTNLLCRYLFKRPTDNVCKIKFKIKTFDVNNYPSKIDHINCDNGDYLEIINNKNRLCGYKLQEEFIIDYKDKSNYLPLYFYSDSAGVSTGFDISFENLANSCIGKDPLICKFSYISCFPI